MTMETSSSNNSSINPEQETVPLHEAQPEITTLEEEEDVEVEQTFENSPTENRTLSTVLLSTTAIATTKAKRRVASLSAHWKERIGSKSRRLLLETRTRTQQWKQQATKIAREETAKAHQRILQTKETVGGQSQVIAQQLKSNLGKQAVQFQQIAGKSASHIKNTSVSLKQQIKSEAYQLQQTIGSHSKHLQQQLGSKVSVYRNDFILPAKRAAPHMEKKGVPKIHNLRDILGLPLDYRDTTGTAMILDTRNVHLKSTIRRTEKADVDDTRQFEPAANAYTDTDLSSTRRMPVLFHDHHDSTDPIKFWTIVERSSAVILVAVLMHSVLLLLRRRPTTATTTENYKRKHSLTATPVKQPPSIVRYGGAGAATNPVSPMPTHQTLSDNDSSGDDDNEAAPTTPQKQSTSVAELLRAKQEQCVELQAKLYAAKERLLKLEQHQYASRSGSSTNNASDQQQQEQQLAKLQELNTELKALMEGKDLQCLDLVTQVQQLNQDLTTRETQMSNLLSSYQKQKEELDQLKQTRTTTSNTTTTKDTARLEEQLQQASASLKDTKKQCDDLTRRLKQVTDELEVREREQDRLYSKLEHQLKLNDELQQKLQEQEELVEEHEDEQEELTTKIAELYNDISLRDLEMKQLQTQMDQRIDHVIVMEQQLSHQKQVHAKQRARNETLLQTNQTLNELLEREQEQTRALEGKVANLVKQLDSLQRQQRGKLQRSKESRHDDTSSRPEEEEEGDIDKVHQEMASLQQEARASRDKTSKLSLELARQQEEVARLQEQIEQIKAKSAEKVFRIRQVYEGQLQERDSEYKTMQSQLQEQLQAKEAQYHEFLEQLQSLESSSEANKSKKKEEDMTREVPSTPSASRSTLANPPVAESPGLHEVLTSEVSFLLGL